MKQITSLFINGLMPKFVSKLKKFYELTNNSLVN